MFQVRDVEGILRPFTVGQIRARRRVQPVAAIDETEPVAKAIAPLSYESTEAERLRARYEGGSPREQSRREVLRAHEIMSCPVTTVPAGTLMSEVNRIFTTRRFRHLPICSATGLLVGLISDRDALRFSVKALSERLHVESTTVSAVMVTDILTATPDTLIRDIARTLFDERIGSIPIVDHLGSIQGMITRSDIMRALITHGPIQLWA